MASHRGSFFCTTCKVNKQLCKAPSLHTSSPIPATLSGHVSWQALHEKEGQAVLWTQNCVNWGSLGNLERATPCSNGQSCLKKPSAKLSLILGQDLHHVAHQLVSDKYGSMSIYTCSLSKKLIRAGNRMYPYTEKTARIAL